MHEFHGNMRQLRCLDCNKPQPISSLDLNALPPRCPACGGLVKPDFIFFGEAIPAGAWAQSELLAQSCDAVIIAGASGQVMPAASIPLTARQCGVPVVEVNVGPSAYTGSVSDVFIQARAGEALPLLADALLGA